MKPTRRGAITGGVTVAALASAVGAYKLRLFGRHYRATPYDDLLDQIVDRAPASALGKAVIKIRPDFNAETVAVRLRQSSFTLRTRAQNDASAGRMMEVDGWVVPQSVALYAALAARF
jgi:hypothetical protein